MSLLISTGETLMQWRESNASVRKYFSPRKFATVIAMGIAIVGVMVAIRLWLQPEKPFPHAILFLLPIIGFGFLSGWFSSGAIVCLNEFCVVRQVGRYGSRSNYDEIERCTVRTESYDGKKLSVIEFKLKDKSKFLINTPVETIVIPKDVNLDQVLQIFRDKGVNVIEGHLTS